MCIHVYLYPPGTIPTTVLGHLIRCSPSKKKEGGSDWKKIFRNRGKKLDGSGVGGGEKRGRLWAEVVVILDVLATDVGRGRASFQALPGGGGAGGKWSRDPKLGTGKKRSLVSAAHQDLSARWITKQSTNATGFTGAPPPGDGDGRKGTILVGGGGS